MKKYEGRKFVCAKCKKVAYSKFEDIENCRSCRTVAKNHSNCQKCGRKFYTTIGKKLCRFCFAIEGHYQSESYRRRQHRESKAVLPAIERYQSALKILFVKYKWNLLNQIDIFKICHIYMECTSNENKYSNLETGEQVQYMLLELNNIMKGSYVPEPRKGRKVLHINSKGHVLGEYASLNACAKHFDVYLSYVRNSCEHGGYLGKKVSKRLRFRYAD